MSDNTQLNVTSGGDTIRDLARQSGSVKTPVTQIDIGGASANAEVLLTAGQQTMAASMPVVIASNQTNLPTTTLDGTGLAINSLAAGTGQNGLLVAMGATNFFYSTVNASAAQLAPGAIFPGAIETALNEPSASILLTSDQPITFNIFQYEDAGGLLIVSQWTYYIMPGVAFSRSFVINGNYLKFTAQNTGPNMTTTFNLNVAYGAIPSATNLGNANISINEINGTAIAPGGSLPVSIVSSTAVPDPATIAAQSSDQPLFTAITGDPMGDFAGIDFMSALFDPTQKMPAQVQVTNPALIDTVNPGANGGVVPTDGPTWFLSSGGTLVIPTAGYQSVTCHSILGQVSVSISNVNTSAAFISPAIVAMTGGTTYQAYVSTGAMGSIPAAAAYMKFTLPIAAGNGAVIQLRQQPFSAALINAGLGVNLQTITGSAIITAGVSGMLAVGGNTAVGSAPTANPIALAWDGANVRRILTDTVSGGVTLGANAVSNGCTLGVPVIMAATPVTNAIKGGSGRLMFITVSNSNTTGVYLKLFNVVSATIGTTTPSFNIYVPPTASFTVPIHDIGLYFSTGISFTVTGAIALLDTTAITASTCSVSFTYV